MNDETFNEAVEEAKARALFHSARQFKGERDAKIFADGFDAGAEAAKNILERETADDLK